MGETQSRLNWQHTGLTSKEATTGCTAMIAVSHGVTYRVVGTIVPGRMTGRRTFRAYRMTDDGNRSVPAGEGGEHKTRSAAYAQAEADLNDVLADRSAEQAQQTQGRRDFPTAYDGQGNVIVPGARKYVGRSCCASTGGDVHDRSCQTPEAREQWAPKRMREAVQIAAGVMTAAAASDALEPDPATADDIAELVERIVRRAQYEALRMVLSVLDEGIQSTSEFCHEQGHGSANQHDDGRLCGEAFDVDDFQRMVNDAARRLHTAQPWHPDA